MRGIVFDFDDTLVNSSAAYVAGYLAIGIEPRGAALAAARQGTKDALGEHTSRHHRLLYFQRLQRQGQLPGAPGPAGLLAAMAAYESAVCQHIAQQWQSLRRTELLHALRLHARLGVLTNETARTQLTKWAAVDPSGNLFDAFVTSEEVGQAKPHPSTFQAAAEQLGLPLSACTMVGDSLTADIQPALALGMAAIWTQEFAEKGHVSPELNTGGPSIVEVTCLNEILSVHSRQG